MKVSTERQAPHSRRFDVEIATLGDIAFKVDSQLVKTLSEFSRSGSARWAVHEVIGDTVKPEFVGPGQGELSFRITLLSELGTEPRNDADELWEMMKEGKVEAFIIGGIPVGEGKWYIDSIEESETILSTRGEYQKIELSVTLREYF